jgi:hypothetical protein
MNKKQILKQDIKSMEDSIAFHKSRVETFGQPNRKGPMHARPFDGLNPKHILPFLEKMLKEMKAELKTKKA